VSSSRCVAARDTSPGRWSGEAAAGRGGQTSSTRAGRVYGLPEPPGAAATSDAYGPRRIDGSWWSRWLLSGDAESRKPKLCQSGKMTGFPHVVRACGDRHSVYHRHMPHRTRHLPHAMSHVSGRESGCVPRKGNAAESELLQSAEPGLCGTGRARSRRKYPGASCGLTVHGRWEQGSQPCFGRLPARICHQGSRMIVVSWPVSRRLWKEK
jgi:hypothetical protein